MSSAERHEVNSVVRGGEANRELNNSLNNSPLLQTNIYHTANTTLFTHSTFKPAFIYQLNHTHNTLIYYFVLYLADKAGNTKINTQQLNLLS